MMGYGTPMKEFHCKFIGVRKKRKEHVNVMMKIERMLEN